MLKLIDVEKTYKMGDLETHALKGINLEFRKSEFVSILGPSGCGKTTLLNIIGGLDKYSSGDLVINEKSTKEYKDKDWDAYRNHSIGFVFQSYNLIPHQTVLENVELALTLSGVSKEERKKRATEVLKKVGLEDKLKNKPNQLSGGQMQRVAIARALVNDPEIILADEPTGALDTASSVQIMELLKEISKDKLIIMVTHNPDLATKYSTRIVSLLDGKVTGDTNPFDSSTLEKQEKQLLTVADDSTLTKRELKKKNKKRRMSFFTAFMLSLKNLLTKKGRTILVTFAGSIGIIGIALILAISTGFSGYIDRMQQDTLSTYPVTIQTEVYDMAGLMQIFMSDSDDGVILEDGTIHTKDELTEMLSQFNSSTAQNNLKELKAYFDTTAKDELSKYASAIQYGYDLSINAYLNSDINGLVPVNSTEIFNNVINEYYIENQAYLQTNVDAYRRFSLIAGMFSENSTFSVFSSTFWSEMLDNQVLLEEQYELVGENSRWATEYNEIMIVVDKNYQITDYTLFALGLLDQSKLENLLNNYVTGTDSDAEETTFSYEELLNTEYKIIPRSSYFVNIDGLYVDINDLKDTNREEYNRYLQEIYNDPTKTITLKVAGIIRENPDSSAHSISTNIGYTSKLTDYIIQFCTESEVVDLQRNSETNIQTGENFDTQNTLEAALLDLGYIDKESPSSIKIYPKDFESKSMIMNIIEEYNSLMLSQDKQENIITYSDTIGTMMSTISTIISAITYVLIAFVGVSLIVSSIMIGIITYISVIERTKEIGVLRSIGASKRDVSRVFTAESFIIGISSGIFGIVVSLLLTIPINVILYSFTGISNMASLPVIGAIILILISVLLTLFAGLFPSRVTAKKDPVVALREN